MRAAVAAVMGAAVATSIGLAGCSSGNSGTYQQGYSAAQSWLRQPYNLGGGNLLVPASALPHICSTDKLIGGSGADKTSAWVSGCVARLEAQDYENWTMNCTVLSDHRFQLFATNTENQDQTPPGWTVVLFDNNVQVGNSDSAGVGPVLPASAVSVAVPGQTIQSNVWTIPSMTFTRCKAVPYTGGPYQ